MPWDPLSYLLRNNYDCVCTPRAYPAAETFEATAEDIASVQRHNERSMEAKPCRKCRQSIMGMHNVVRRATRHSKNLNGTLQIIQFGPESENIDDVDRMAEPAQLLCLLPHESSIIWRLRSRVHIRDKEYPHRSALRLVESVQASTSLRICHRQLVKLYRLFNHP